MTDESLLESVKTCLNDTDIDDMGAIFSMYCKNTLGLSKRDRRKKDNRNTYYASSKGYNGNKIECGIYGNKTEFLGERLYIVLRKRSGWYIVIGENNAKRLVEYDGQVRHYDPDGLRNLIDQHPVLFKKLGIGD